ncbi:hypothetical protein DSL72_002097 [Monilinia vaccinii-corymbosi]|uniref:Dienelactone hydrolase domain-containing protein n=1 Tax=Monilinia vaccinii-corymbosi TaxID=61207 RepID=A0A8A3PBP9_9HELO|nr:hypothetical protein DSL72_002097 [Monilinia vaccinii-corymbosi]
MADEIATRAPESDAMEESTEVPLVEQSPVPGDTPAQSASGQASSGEITQLGGVDVYISKPSEYPHAPSKLLLLLTGATGMHSVNNQIQADKFAGEGFLVIMPDMFHNDPLPGSVTYVEDKDPSFIERLKMHAAEAAKSFLADMWLARQTPEKILPIIHKVIEAAKDEFADAVANGGGIYSVGYCLGGRMTLLLAGEKSEAVHWGHQVKDEESAVEKKGPYIKAGAIAHATLVGKEDWEGTKAPLAFICVEADQLFPDEVQEVGKTYLNENNVEYEFKTYSGVPHGFAIVGDYEQLNIKQAQAEAYDQILAWLKAH